MPSKKALDFTNVKDRKFNSKHIPSGDYKMRVLEVEDHESEAGNEGWVYTLSIMSGTGKGASFPYYCMFEEKSLWKVRNLLQAAGVKVPKKRVAVDPKIVVGKDVGAAVEDDDFEGRPRSVVTAVFPLSEMAERAAEEEDEDEDEEEEERPRRRSRSKAKSRARDEEDEEEEDEEDEDDEEEPPRRSKARKSSRSNSKKSPRKARRARSTDVDEEEEEVDEDELEELEI